MAKAKDNTSSIQRDENGRLISTGSSDVKPLLNKDGSRAKRKKTASEESQERLEKKKREERREAKEKEKEAKKAAKQAAEEQAQTPAAERSLIKKASETAKEDAPLEASVSIAEVKKAEDEAAGRGNDGTYTTDMFTGGFNHAGSLPAVTATKPKPFDVQVRPDGNLYVYSPIWNTYEVKLSKGGTPAEKGKWNLVGAPSGDTLYAVQEDKLDGDEVKSSEYYLAFNAGSDSAGVKYTFTEVAKKFEGLGWRSLVSGALITTAAGTTVVGGVVAPKPWEVRILGDKVGVHILGSNWRYATGYMDFEYADRSEIDKLPTISYEGYSYVDITQSVIKVGGIASEKPVSVMLELDREDGKLNLDVDSSAEENESKPNSINLGVIRKGAASSAGGDIDERLKDDQLAVCTRSVDTATGEYKYTPVAEGATYESGVEYFLVQFVSRMVYQGDAVKAEEETDYYRFDFKIAAHAEDHIEGIL